MPFDGDAFFTSAISFKSLPRSAAAKSRGFRWVARAFKTASGTLRLLRATSCFLSATILSSIVFVIFLSQSLAEYDQPFQYVLGPPAVDGFFGEARRLFPVRRCVAGDKRRGGIEHHDISRDALFPVQDAQYCCPVFL